MYVDHFCHFSYFFIKSRILFHSCEMRCQQLIIGSWDHRVRLIGEKIEKIDNEREKIEEKMAFMIVYLFDYDEKLERFW